MRPSVIRQHNFSKHGQNHPGHNGASPHCSAESKDSEKPSKALYGLWKKLVKSPCSLGCQYVRVDTKTKPDYHFPFDCLQRKECHSCTHYSTDIYEFTVCKCPTFGRSTIHLSWWQKVGWYANTWFRAAHAGRKTSGGLRYRFWNPSSHPYENVNDNCSYYEQLQKIMFWCLHGEAMSSDEEGFRQALPQMRQMKADHRPEDVWNADEFVRFL